MNKTKVEQAGIGIIENAYMCVKGVVPHINKDDKLVSWDGHICIYRDDSEKKEELQGKIDVQVKTRTLSSREFHKLTSMASYSADTPDLKNYLNAGGCMYYVVYIEKDKPQNFKAYYAMLTVSSLRTYLKNVKSDKVKIHIRMLPDDNKRKGDILREFLAHRELQMSYVHRTLMGFEDIINNPNDKSVVVYNSSSGNVWDSPYPEEINWYLKDKNNLIPLENTMALGKGYDITENLLLGNEIIDNHYRVLFMGDKVKVIIGNLIIMTFSRNDIDDSDGNFRIVSKTDRKEMIDFSISKEASIRDCANFLGFFIRMVNGEKLYFASIGTELKLKGTKKAKDEYISDLAEQWKACKAVVEFWDSISYEGDLARNKLSIEDQNNLNLLVNGVHLHKPIELNVDDQDAGFFIFEVAGWKYIAGFIKASNNKYEIVNPFTDKFYADPQIWPENDKLYSIYTILSPELMNSCINIKWDYLVSSFDRREKSPEKYIEALRCLYYIMNAYLEKKSVKLQSSISSLSTWIYSNIPEDIFDSARRTIGMLEGISFSRDLSEEEKESLYNICDSSSESEWNKLLAYTLLANTDYIKRYYKKVDTLHQQAYLKMPISYSFRNKMDS